MVTSGNAASGTTATLLKSAKTGGPQQPRSRGAKVSSAKAEGEEEQVATHAGGPSIHVDGFVVRVEAGPGVGNVAELEAWLSSNRNVMRSHLEEHGAVVLRGFGVQTALDFERVGLALNPNLSDRYPGGAPRTKHADHVWTASETPQHMPISSHCELSYLPPIRPKQILFCSTQTADTGGETPIARMDHVKAKLPARLQQQRNLEVVRFFPAEKRRCVDVRRLKNAGMPWPTVLGTSDPDVVTADAAKDGASVTFWSSGPPPLVQWLLRVAPPVGAVLRALTGLLPLPLSDMAVEGFSPGAGVRLSSKLPLHKDGCYGGIDVFFHEYGWLVEMFFVARRSRALRDIAVLMVIAVVTIALAMLRLIGLVGPSGLDLRDADTNQPLSLRDIWALDKAYWESFVFHKWEQGDVVVLNNDLCSHGRITYTGKRTVFTAFG